MKDQSNKTNKDLKGWVEFGIEFGNVNAGKELETLIMNQKEQKHKKKDSSKKER
ncbi:hypothetical protein P5F77_03045 [Caldifermentibacillus hisashii]|uniref:hypothetical protein n=1 Tax=Caldifermentibacillus hisashii TaxID=996558 RepID=UPI0030D65D4D